MNTSGYLSMRKSVRRYELTMFLNWTREGSPEMFRFLSGLSEEQLADALAAAMLVRNAKGQLWSSVAPPRMVLKRLELGLSLAECADKLRKLGTLKGFTGENLDRIEGNTTARQNADFWTRHAIENLYQEDWTTLCAAVDDGLIGPTSGCA